ncbi:hypothetical protein MKQ70_30685 [Chitinophaga sedimenti]|uniref:hypothetical protein n=1 Tax=Chitinophaga sedimenti TaxID=2033606 RepID=UPI0020048E2D|nr:hypothetical protein [Chitinophaga sedimenti]MCK7559106.1 hypothetical protein [Chitinophaga sedimenti]
MLTAILKYTAPVFVLMADTPWEVLASMSSIGAFEKKRQINVPGSVNTLRGNRQRTGSKSQGTAAIVS